MLVVGAGARPRVLASEKGGISEMKAKDMSGVKNTLARGRNCRKRIGLHSKSPSESIMTSKIKS